MTEPPPSRRPARPRPPPWGPALGMLLLAASVGLWLSTRRARLHVRCQRSDASDPGQCERWEEGRSGRREQLFFELDPESALRVVTLGPGGEQVYVGRHLAEPRAEEARVELWTPDGWALLFHAEGASQGALVPEIAPFFADREVLSVRAVEQPDLGSQLRGIGSLIAALLGVLALLAPFAARRAQTSERASG